MEKLDLGAKSLRKFAVVMGVACTVFTLIIFFKHTHSILPTAITGLLFFLVGIVAPTILKPLYIIWMRFAFVLGFINTRIILCAMFYLVFTPIGLVLKLFRVDLLERKREKKDSYWHKRDSVNTDLTSYERQY